jgi:hypothetical protein
VPLAAANPQPQRHHAAGRPGGAGLTQKEPGMHRAPCLMQNLVDLFSAAPAPP